MGSGATSGRESPTHTAFTGLKPKLTVINTAVFQELEPVYRRTLAHELGTFDAAARVKDGRRMKGNGSLKELPEELVFKRPQ